MNFNQILFKNQILLLFLITSSSFFLACQGDDSNSLKFNESNFNEFVSLYKKDHYDKFLIIPGSGCEGCISQAEQYVINNAKTEVEGTMIIFTNISSKKLLRLRLGQEIMDQPNVLLDSINILHFVSIYPVLVERQQMGGLRNKELKSKLFDIYQD